MHNNRLLVVWAVLVSLVVVLSVLSFLVNN